MLIAAGLNPLWFSSTNGFLCQIYGTAALVFFLAVLSRLLPETRQNAGGAVLLALAASLVTSVYSELMPIVGFASIAWLAGCFFKEGTWARTRHMAVLSVGCISCYLFFANIEILRSLKAIWIMANMNGVGAHLDWTALHYWTFLMGAKRFLSFTDLPIRAGTMVALAVATSFFCFGLMRGIRSYRTLPIFASLFLLACLGAYFRWFARDPWSGAIGHTWNQFKLCKWSYPLIVVVQASGIGVLSRKRTLIDRSVVPFVCVLFIILNVWRVSNDVKFTIVNYHRLYQSKHPLASLQTLRHQIDAINPSALYFFAAEKDPLRSITIPYLLTPRPFYNAWPADCFPQPSPVCFPPFPTSVIGLRYGDPPFEKAQRQLECGLCLVDLRHSFIARVEESATRHRQSTDQVEVGIGYEETFLELWSPQTTSGSLSFGLYPAKTDTFPPHWKLHVIVDGDVKHELIVSCAESVTIPIDARSGITRILIFCSDGNIQAGPRVDLSPTVFMTHCQFTSGRH
jgi:hypothetical protein